MSMLTKEPKMTPKSSPATTMVGLRKLHSAPGMDYCTDVPVPTVGPHDVLIKVRKAGICGTDRGIFEWGPWAKSRVKVGIVIGHEVMGTIASFGTSVDNLSIGQRVSVEGHINCGVCQPCRTGNAHVCDKVRIIGIDRDGTFAEYLCVPASNIWPLHDDIPDRVGAIMDPLGNAVHTVMTAGVSGKSVLITGVGIIGLMAVSVARAAGAAHLIAADIDESRLELAKKLGADQTIVSKGKDWPDEVRRLTQGLGPEVICEMSGSTQAIQGGLAALRNCGTLAILGLPKGPVEINFNDHIIFKGTRIVGINGRRMYETWYQAEELILSGKVNLDPIITHEIPLKDFKTGFDLMASGEAIKVLFNVS
jgi:threonine 3-dehydrogenase